jgi:hypothetical protein
MPSAGAEHPEPQFVLAITVFEDVMYALCFTAGSRPDAIWDGASGGEVRGDDGGGLRGAPTDDTAEEFEGTPLSVTSIPNDSSFMEIFALDLMTRIWSKVVVAVRPVLARVL